MKKNNSKEIHFPNYNKLTWFEKQVLNTCCYYPPLKRRTRGKEDEFNFKHYKWVFQQAYGDSIFFELNGKKILDFGCGQGTFSLIISNECKNSEVVGLDIIDDFDAAFRIKKEMNLSNVNFICGNSKLIEDNSFDVVFSHDSFEHFENPEFVLSEMIRITKVGGELLIKFGPTWAGPYGRHMSGTFKKSRPWIHLFLPEKTIMRVHSVYHNNSTIYEKYRDLKGGLNKMTTKKADSIIRRFSEISILDRQINYVGKGGWLKKVFFLKEFFTDSMFLKLKKNNHQY